jgi:hypothetical protein
LYSNPSIVSIPGVDATIYISAITTNLG